MTGLFEYFKRRSAAARLSEEQTYEQVVFELQNGQRRSGLWAKAVAHSNGEEAKAKAMYIHYRMQSIKDEIEISKAFDEEAENLESQEKQASHTEEAEPIPHNPTLDEELFGAVIAGELRRVKYLVASGANPNTKNSMGYSPLDHARGNCHTEIEEFLKMARPNKANSVDAKKRRG
jgi:hypothetical protein